MPFIGPNFDDLPPELAQVVARAEAELGLSITPLDVLVGGWSGAYIYLASVLDRSSALVQHVVLKLDRKKPQSTSDERSRHDAAVRLSPPGFASEHIPAIVYPVVETEQALAICYTIAGQSLRSFLPLSRFPRQRELETLMRVANFDLLTGWNPVPEFQRSDHPAELLNAWLGFRLKPGQPTETFLRDEVGLPPDIPGFVIAGEVYPNPLAYAREQALWGNVRAADAAFGLMHGDLNANNLLAMVSPGGEDLNGFYLIDFALFKEKMPLLYDQRYLEISFLAQALLQESEPDGGIPFAQMLEREIPEPAQLPIRLGGPAAAIRAGRLGFQDWVHHRYPSLHDDLWGQFWLAGAAAGLSYAHKAGQSSEVRLSGLVYAAANLRHYFKLFGLDLPAEAAGLRDRMGGLSSRTGGVSVASRNRIALPIPPTRFVGRESELTALRSILEDGEIRLVTLTGPGGTGKTRLALEAAQAARFRDGVHFVDLSALTDPDLLASASAHALGVRDGGGRPPLENLKDFLSGRELLLLLDNFEQIAAASHTVAELLLAAPGLKLLVTSRIALRIRGEHEFPVRPLQVPEIGFLTAGNLLDYEAAALFVQQAAAANPGFKLTDEDTQAIAEICRRLDGLPLAIEIAAARIRILPPGEILRRLDESLKLLVGGPRDLPYRQQALRRTIDWSYDLLEPPDRELFVRLSVFAGGFTLESAEAICNSDGALDLLGVMDNLVASSLVRRAPSFREAPRFDMLRIIREYAEEKAVIAGDFEGLRTGHSAYFVSVAAGEGAGAEAGPESVFWLRWIEEEFDNFRLAIPWGLDRPEMILPTTSALVTIAWFMYRFGHFQEGIALTRRAVEVTESTGDSPARLLALLARAFIAVWTADLEAALDHGLQAVQLAERLGIEEALSYSNLAMGVILINRGRDREAYPHLVDAVEQFDQQGSDWMKGTALVHLANVSLGLGQIDEARRWLDIALPLMEASNDPWLMAFALNNYGEIARAQGDYKQAEGFYLRTEAFYKQADAAGDQARLLHTFGYLALHRQDLAEARRRFRESLAAFRILGNQRGVAECLAGLGVLEVEEGKLAHGAALIAAAEGQLTGFGGVWWPADRVEIERTRATLREQLGDSFDEAWASGARLGAEAALALADADEPSGFVTSTGTSPSR